MRSVAAICGPRSSLESHCSQPNTASLVYRPLPSAIRQYQPHDLLSIKVRFAVCQPSLLLSPAILFYVLRTGNSFSSRCLSLPKARTPRHEARHGGFGRSETTWDVGLLDKLDPRFARVRRTDTQAPTAGQGTASSCLRTLGDQRVNQVERETKAGNTSSSAPRARGGSHQAPRRGLFGGPFRAKLIPAPGSRSCGPSLKQTKSPSPSPAEPCAGCRLSRRARSWTPPQQQHPRPLPKTWTGMPSSSTQGRTGSRRGESGRC